MCVCVHGRKEQECLSDAHPKQRYIRGCLFLLWRELDVRWEDVHIHGCLSDCARQSVVVKVLCAERSHARDEAQLARLSPHRAAKQIQRGREAGRKGEKDTSVHVTQHAHTHTHQKKKKKRSLSELVKGRNCCFACGRSFRSLLVVVVVVGFSKGHWLHTTSAMQSFHHHSSPLITDCWRNRPVQPAL